MCVRFSATQISLSNSKCWVKRFGVLGLFDAAALVLLATRSVQYESFPNQPSNTPRLAAGNSVPESLTSRIQSKPHFPACFGESFDAGWQRDPILRLVKAIRPPRLT